MAWAFGESWDLYAAVGDLTAGYWDSGAGTPTFVAGRFAGSQALNIAATTVSLTKSSGVNDAVHHLVVAFRQTAAISGATLGAYLQLLDGATGQCAIVFRSDGAILLTSGTAAGTTLATYTGAFPATNTWYAFEIEIAINNTTGSFTVRKNGNSVNDFSATALNTRTSANNYANKLTLGMQAAVSAQQFDDFFWQSGAATGNWLGDIRCYARMPASDTSVTFSKSSTGTTQSPFNSSFTPQTSSSTLSWYMQFTSSNSGTVGTVTAQINAGFTGNIKCSVFNDSGGTQPTTVVASAPILVNPVTGANTFTFSTPFVVVKGVNYWVGLIADGAYANAWSASTIGTIKYSTSVAYASFPVATPAMVGGGNGPNVSWAIIVSANAFLVNEAQQDGLTTYVYDGNPGDADFYGIASIASTPATVIATTVRGYAQKSDAGSRTAAVQLKSGATTVASPTLVLTTSGWQWAWRTDLTDPATGAAWTPAAVNNCTIGPRVVA